MPVGRVVTDRKRAWARITTASSAALLLMAVISLWQVFDDYNELYNPESNSLVKLGLSLIHISEPTRPY